MGADACCAGGDFVTRQQEPKIFQHGDLLIGGCGQKRAGQIVKYLVAAPPREGRGTHKYLVQSWIPAVREAINAQGHQRTNEGTDEMAGAFLVAAHDGVFFVGGDFGVDAMGEFGAAGSGEQVATGAMAMLQLQPLTPREILTCALEAAEQYISTVCAPFTILRLEETNTNG